MSTDLNQVVLDQAKKLADQMDQCLADFFGSKEAIRVYGHMYVLEQTSSRMETCLQPELTGDYFKLRTETSYRIRPKTLAELEEDRRD
jgi:hypothetical protein